MSSLFTADSQVIEDLLSRALVAEKERDHLRFLLQCIEGQAYASNLEEIKRLLAKRDMTWLKRR